MKYNQHILFVIFMLIAIAAFIAYIVRDTVRTHPAIVLSISLLALVGIFAFINPNEENNLQTVTVLGALLYLILMLSTLLIEMKVH